MEIKLLFLFVSCISRAVEASLSGNDNLINCLKTMLLYQHIVQNITYMVLKGVNLKYF